jgi:hypothetical protein
VTSKAAFNAEEWSEVVAAPYLVGLLMIGASRGGTVRETMAISRAYESARQHYAGDLFGQLLSTPPALDPASAPKSHEELHQSAVAMLRRAVGSLDRLATPDEVNNYKRFVYFVAETVAQAHREGGFLGLGGRAVSDPEQAVLDEIAAIFDASPPADGPEPPPTAS